MKTQRVLVLVHRDLVPPEDLTGIEDPTVEPWRTEYGVTATIRKLGHEARVLGVYDDLGLIRRTVEEYAPTILFNLLEEFGGEAVLDQNVVSYIETLGVPHTGCNPMGLLIARDKALSKKLLTYHRIRVPQVQVFLRGQTVRRARSLPFPIFLKSLVEDASLGISQQSIVQDEESLAERVAFIHEKVATHAIGEQYIPGKDLYVGVIGNDRLKTLPPLELEFTEAAADAPQIATRRAKFDKRYQEKMGIRTSVAKLPPEVLSHVHRTTRRIFKVLCLNGYARMDFRMTEDHQLYFLEANPNPELAAGEDFAVSAEKAGLKYRAMIERILQLGLTWRGRS